MINQWSHALNLGRALVFAVLCIANSGCLLAAAGATGAGTYAYAKGNVKDTFSADFPAVWEATQVAMNDLALPVVSQYQEGSTGMLESVSGNDKRIRVQITQEPAKIPADPPKTKVGIRVATFGDEAVSRRILQQIETRLNSVQPAAYKPKP